MFKLLFLPVKVVRLITKLAGVKGSLLLVVGIGIGLLVAPQTGKQLRAKLQAKLAGVADPLPADQDLSL
jgi:hypothetical protein